MPQPLDPLDLKAVQGRIGRAIQTAETAPAAALIRPGKFAGAEILAIHQNHFRSSLIDALAANFPAVLALIGEDYFHHVARKYLLAAPPRGPILAEYGRGFADLLAAEDALQPFAYLAHVARLEWLWNEAFHEADADPLTPERLTEILTKLPAHSAPDLSVHPTLRLIRSVYPLADLWQMARFGDVAPDDIDLSPSAYHFLILRRRQMPEIHLLDAGSYAFLQSLAVDMNFDAAAAAALLASPDFSLEGSLGSLLLKGAFIDPETSFPDMKGTMFHE